MDHEEDGSSESPPKVQLTQDELKKELIKMTSYASEFSTKYTRFSDFARTVPIQEKWHSLLERAEELHAAPGDPSKPFEPKYEARKIWIVDIRRPLCSFLPAPPTFEQKNFNQDIDLDETLNRDLRLAVGILDLRIGQNMMECDEVDIGQGLLEWAHVIFCKYAIGESTKIDHEEGGEAALAARLRNATGEGKMAWTESDSSGNAKWKDSDDYHKLSLELAYLPDAQEACNQLGVLWAQREDYKKSCEYFQRAEILYARYLQLISRGIKPLSRLLNVLAEQSRGSSGNGVIDVMQDLVVLDIDEEEEEKVEKKEEEKEEKEKGKGEDKEKEEKEDKEEKAMKELFNFGPSRTPEDVYIHTLYYLAQVYGRLNEIQKSAEYCHLTLANQLSTGKFDKPEWCNNALQMGGFFISLMRFSQADLCMRAALKVLPDEKEGEKLDEEAKDELERARANTGLAIARMHLRRLTEAAKGDLPPEETEGDLLQFEELDIVQRIFPPITDFGTAREAFLESIEGFEKAKAYYVLDGFVTDFVAIMQDISQLYKALAHFESDPDRKVKMHRRRALALEGTANELNAHYYLTLIRQMRFELGDIYSEISSVRLEQREECPTDTKLSFARINRYIDQGVEQYVHFVDSYKDPFTGVVPTEFNEDDIRPYLVARFNIAHLCGKIVHPDARVLLSYQRRAYNEYEWITDYCAGHEEQASNHFGQEWGVCRDMKQLLPVRIHNLMKHISGNT